MGDDQAGRGRRAPGAAPPRPASRCGRRARTACRRAPAPSAGRAPRGPARAAAADRPTAPCPARRSGCRGPTGRSWTNSAWATSSACSISSSVASAAAEGEVLAGAHREQRRLLERRRHQRAQVPEVELADVDAVDGDPAAGDVVEPRHQRGEDGLAGAGRADQATVSPGARSRSTSRRTSSSEPGNAKSTCSKRSRPTRVLDHPGAGHDGGLGVEDLEDPGGRGHRLLGHRQDHAERGDRPHQREHQRDEGDQLARREVAAADADRAEQQHDDDREVGDHLEERPELRRQPDLVHARGVQLAGGARRTAPRRARCGRTT